jgi:protein-L-isoaspartate(D-aspartate) O-methyltransferase
MQRPLAIPLMIFFLIIPGQVWTDDQDLTYATKRKRMVRTQIEDRGIENKSVLEAMAKVPRHQFVPNALQSKAYTDRPLPIGEGQTISQPYIVALMTESLQLEGHERVLEIGTGSGYQAAILAEIVNQVYTVEIKPKLHRTAAQLLKALEYRRIDTIQADGYWGWKEKAPFDCIMITAAVDHIPPTLLSQLRDGGKLILPLGNPFSYQNLVLVTKQADDYSVRQITGVLFVPMTGHALKP